MSPTELLTVAEAAERLGVHAQTVRAMYRAGDLPVVRIGRVVRIPASGIAALVERAEAEAEGRRTDSAAL